MTNLATQSLRPVFFRYLTPSRLRRQALLLAIALWLGYAVTLATPGLRDRFGHLKGADFLHAYVLGSIALEHRGDALYDARIQRDIAEQRVPASAGDYFLPVYGPQYSLLWAPFALLPYPWAAALWMLLSAAIYAACCYAIWQTCPNLQAHAITVALAAAAFPGFFALITFGQNSALALAAFTATYFSLRARREWLAGLCLGLLAYKPQLAIVPACVFFATCLAPGNLRANRRDESHQSPVPEGRATLAQRFSAGDGVTNNPSPGGTTQPACGNAPNAGSFQSASAAEGAAFDDRQPAARHSAAKIILGAIISIAAQFAAAWVWFGPAPLITYTHVLTHLNTAAPILEPKPYLMHSLRAFWNLLLPWPRAAFILYLITALATTWLSLVCWRRPAPLEQRYSILLLATVLVAPHLTVYDLVILAPALLWIADWLQTHAAPRTAWLVYLSCLLPFAGPLARWTHLQLSVVCLAALTVSFAAQLTRRSGFPET